MMNIGKRSLALKITAPVLLLGIALGFYKTELALLSGGLGTVIQVTRSASLLVLLALLLNSYVAFQLYTKIFIGLVLGVVAGVFFGSDIGEMKPVGDAFIRLISLIVVPLVFVSLVVGTASVNDVRKLGRIGGKTVAYYLATTSVAIVIGLVLANSVAPGTGLSPDTREALLASYEDEAGHSIAKAEEKPSVADTLLNIIPENPVRSMAEGKMLQIIFFALVLGVAFTLIPNERAAPVIAVFDGLNDAMICIVNIAMAVAPYGVFALIAAIVGQYGVGILETLIKYSAVVAMGLLIHATVIYPTALKIFTKISICDFFRGIRPAQLIAFSSSSSSATLPVTMKSAEENLGVSPKVASFVLPLGATINMDGTALYQGVAAVFIAQVYGLDLGIGDQLTVLLTATLASIGAAGVPGVGMITLALVLKSIQIPLEGIALILGVDRILDMCRTAVNVTGDASAAVIIAASEGELKT
ncbi:MAG: dicarboxylate/amino acid:cation symporter [Myxococcota bacterium]|nr:dicarboxylate/amino acid:cation symporter [Myxococcota bacterium]